MKNLSKIILAMSIGFASIGIANAETDNNGPDNVIKTESFKSFADQQKSAEPVKDSVNNEASGPQGSKKYGIGEFKADGQWVNDN